MRHIFKTKVAFDIACRFHKHKARFKENDVALIEETNDAVIYHNGDWYPMTLKSEDGVSLSLFEYNKQLMEQLPVMSDEAIYDAGDMINQYWIKTYNEFYMMLNNNKHYYTIFTDIQTSFSNNEFNTLGDAVITCCKEMGNIKAIDLNEETDAIEIWITTEEDTDCYILFPYNSGVVTIGG